jgi:hypothetical protein
MPNFNGTGPNGAGAMTGRGSGPCGGARALGPGYGRGRGFGRGMGNGFGLGRGMGMGRGLGRIAVGYGSGGEDVAASNIKLALEERKAFLSAEFARTEALLGEYDRGSAVSTAGDEAK